MVVAGDVKNIDGMLLVPAGCTLTERQIGILQAWGVAEVEVAASTETTRQHDPLARLPLAKLAQLTAELQARFWQPDATGPVPEEIFRLMLVRQARQFLKD